MKTSTPSSTFEPALIAHAATLSQLFDRLSSAALSSPDTAPAFERTVRLILHIQSQYLRTLREISRLQKHPAPRKPTAPSPKSTPPLDSLRSAPSPDDPPDDPPDDLPDDAPDDALPCPASIPFLTNPSPPDQPSPPALPRPIPEHLLPKSARPRPSSQNTGALWFLSRRARARAAAL